MDDLYNLADYSVPVNEYRLIGPIQPNIKLSFGGPMGIIFQWHSDNIPNRFQRWMLFKVFGITVERLEEKNT